MCIICNMCSIPVDFCNNNHKSPFLNVFIRMDCDKLYPPTNTDGYQMKRGSKTINNTTWFYLKRFDMFPDYVFITLCNFRSIWQQNRQSNFCWNNWLLVCTWYVFWIIHQNWRIFSSTLQFCSIYSIFQRIFSSGRFTL